MGLVDIVRLLLERGAMPNMEAEECVLRSLAELRGERAIMEFLDSQ